MEQPADKVVMHRIGVKDLCFAEVMDVIWVSFL